MKRAIAASISILLLAFASPVIAQGKPEKERVNIGYAARAVVHAIPFVAKEAGFFRAEGIEAHGQVAHPDPYTAAANAVQDERVDEIIVSTFPGEKRSSWLRGDLVNRLRKHTGLPVEHVEVAPEAEVLA